MEDQDGPMLLLAAVVTQAVKDIAANKKDKNTHTAKQFLKSMGMGEDRISQLVEDMRHSNVRLHK